MRYIRDLKKFFLSFYPLYLQHNKVTPKAGNMKNILLKSTQLIEVSYTNYHHSVYLYIYYKIGSKEEAEDLAQDVFVRLMDYDRMLCAETIKFFIFTIARNLVNDYLRHHYKKQEVTSYMYEHSVTYTDDTESQLIANDLAACEKYKLSLLPPQRRTIYAMSRFEDKSISDISRELNLSCRTVENHLFISRKEVRAFIRQCI